MRTNCAERPHCQGRRITGAAALLAFWLVLPAGLFARSRNIFYFVDYANSWESLSEHAVKIGIVAPQVYSFDARGNVTGSVEPRVRELAAQRNIRILPVIVNRDFSGEAAHAVLSNPGLSAGVIAQAAAQCRRDSCWGLQFDVENLLPGDTASYTAFVREAARQFHAAGLQFGIVVPSPLYPGSLPLEEYSQRFGRFPVTPLPFDFAALGQAADIITVMTYDQYSQRTAPGPMSGYPWTEDTIRYLVQFIPRHRLSLGIGFYARHWCNQKADELTYPEVDALLARTHAEVQWHPWQRAPWFRYPGPGCENVVWFENRKSLKEKLKLVGKYRLHGFSAWRLGQEDPAFWKDVPKP